MQLQGACTGRHAKVCNLCWYWRAKETGMLPLCWLGSLHSVAMYVNTTLLSLAFPALHVASRDQTQCGNNNQGYHIGYCALLLLYMHIGVQFHHNCGYD